MFSSLRGTKILFCGCGLKCFPPLRGTKILFCGCGLKCFPPLRCTKILFCGCGLKCFLPLRGTITKTKRYSVSHHVFSVQCSNRFRKSSRCRLFEVEHSRMSRRSQKPFVDPSEVGWEPQSEVFIWESPGLPAEFLSQIYPSTFTSKSTENRKEGSSKTENSVNFVRQVLVALVWFTVLKFIRKGIESNEIPSVTSFSP